MTPYLVQPSVPPRVQRPKARRNGSTVTPASVQMSLERLDSAALTHQIPGLTQNTSVSSSNVPSLVSSSSSTPHIQAFDGGPSERSDSSRPSFELKDQEQDGLQKDLRGEEGYPSWTGDENLPKPTSSEPANVPPPSSCCGPKVPEPNDTDGQMHQDALQNFFPHDSTAHPTASDGRSSNFGPDLNGSSSHINTALGQFDAPSLDYFPFAESENRRGCSTNGQISRHMDSGGEQHDCHCGDGCECLGCPQHPMNNTMLGYAQYHSMYDSRFSHNHYNGLPPSSQFHQPLYPESQYMNSMSMIPGPGPNLQQQNMQQLQFSPSLHHWDGAAQQYDMSRAALQQTMHNAAGSPQPYSYQYPMAHPTPAPNGHMIQTSQHPAYQRRSGAQKQLTGLDLATDQTLLSSSILDAEQTISHDSPSTDQDDNASVLSTSGFQIQQFRVPGCDDVTGTCRCGNGCVCAGCTVHHGHPGDPRVIDTTSVEAINRPEHEMNTLSNLPDLNGFSLDGLFPNIQHSMTPVSVHDDFPRLIQSPMIPTTGSG